MDARLSGLSLAIPRGESGRYQTAYLWLRPRRSGNRSSDSEKHACAHCKFRRAAFPRQFRSRITSRARGDAVRLVLPLGGGRTRTSALRPGKRKSPFHCGIQDARTQRARLLQTPDAGAPRPMDFISAFYLLSQAVSYHDRGLGFGEPRLSDA